MPRALSPSVLGRLPKRTAAPPSLSQGGGAYLSCAWPRCWNALPDTGLRFCQRAARTGDRGMIGGVQHLDLLDCVAEKQDGLGR